MVASRWRFGFESVLDSPNKRHADLQDKCPADLSESEALYDFK